MQLGADSAVQSGLYDSVAVSHSFTHKPSSVGEADLVELAVLSDSGNCIRQQPNPERIVDKADLHAWSPVLIRTRHFISFEGIPDQDT